MRVARGSWSRTVALTVGLGLFAASVVAAAGCKKDESVGTGNGGTSANALPAAESPFCEIAVAEYSPKVDRSSNTNRSVEESKKVAEDMRSKAPDEIKSDMDAYVEASSTDPKSKPDKAKVEGWLAAAERVVTFIAKTCPSGGPYWACLSQSGFASVGTAIDDSGKPIGTTSTAPPSADAALAMIKDPEGKKVDLIRTDTQVKVGFVNADGRLAFAKETKKKDGRWTAPVQNGCRQS